jgi:small subunit ribosomal protein S20
MAQSLSAKKRVRQNTRRADRNRSYRTRAAHAVRDARDAIEDGDPEAAGHVREAQAALDQAARRNIIHPNAAARRKSRLVRALKAMQPDG